MLGISEDMKGEVMILNDGINSPNIIQKYVMKNRIGFNLGKRMTEMRQV